MGLFTGGVEMSEYDCIGITSEYLKSLKNKIEELEQQIAQLQELQKQKSIIKLCEKLDKAEQQNKEMREFINKHAIEFECPDVCEFLSEHKHYIIQYEP